MNGPRRRLVGLAVVHALFVAAIGAHIGLPLLRENHGKTDFAILHLSAREVWRDGNPYASRLRDPFGDSVRAEGAAPLPDLETPARVGNLNPPFQVVLTAPLGLLSFDRAFWVWHVLSLAAAIAAGFLTARAFLPDRPLALWGPALATALLVYFPSAANSWLGQYGLVLAFFAALAFLFGERRQWTALGVTLGIAAGLKVFAGLFGVLFLLQRRWRALTAFAGAFAATVLVGGVALGWRTYPEYLGMLGQVTWHSASWNVSVFGVATRLLGSAANEGVLLDAPGTGLAVGQVLAVILGLGYCVVVLRWSRTPGERDLRLSLGFTLVMMLLLSPLGWWYYLSALIPACVALVVSAAPGLERRVCAAAVTVFVIASCMTQRLYMSSQLGEEGYQPWRSEMPVLGLLVLAAAHVWLLRRRGASAESGGEERREATVAPQPELRSAGA